MRALTGVNEKEFKVLVPVFAKMLYEEAASKERQRAVGGGNKSILGDASHKLFYILFYLKGYPTYDVAGFVLGAVRSACFAWTKKYWPLIEKTLGRTLQLPKRQIHSVEEFLQLFPGIKDVLVDGTESPLQRPKRYKAQRRKYSGKKKRHTRKTQIITDERKRILVVTKGKDGRVPDVKQGEKSGVHRGIPPGTTLWGDKAYQGLKNRVRQGGDVRTPHKKPRGKPLPPAYKEENKIISSIRIVVEHARGGMKRYRAESDIYRNRRCQDDQMMVVAAGLWNLHLAYAG
ncbi:hypothetical protein AGMMS49949_04640 [Alphaproteobacteria bacterium]|nr:hypothetical protein AGMMS49949_04640 [Alphaproteobacteria bacterium]GHS97529.1 hypothetical protein AGMMS50296_4600 [Alphaproteobacteria bacterium]